MWRQCTGTSICVQVGSAARSRALSAAETAHAKRPCLGQQRLLWLGRRHQPDEPRGLGGLGRALTSVSAAWLISHRSCPAKGGSAGAGATAGAHDLCPDTCDNWDAASPTLSHKENRNYVAKQKPSEAPLGVWLPSGRQKHCGHTSVFELHKAARK